MRYAYARNVSPPLGSKKILTTSHAMSTIAIIGTGISGMAAAYLLHPRHEITVYEKAPRIGGHTRTITVHHGDIPIAVDTGFIVYNIPNYPHLSGLFRHLGVGVQKSDMSFAVTMDGGALEWGSRNLNAVFGQRGNLLRPGFHAMLRDIFAFNKSALPLTRADPALTLRAMIGKLGLGEWLKDNYLLPMGGAIWSCPLQTMMDFPAQTFVQFFENHGLLSTSGKIQWYTVTGGSQEYMRKLTASCADRIRTDCAGVAVTRESGKVQVRDAQGQTREYDQVVFACHADQALALLQDASTEERSLLGAFRYQANRAFLHNDASVMPKRRCCWASWVYQAERATGDQAAIPVTYWMNNLQSIDARFPLFVTLNPLRPIAPEQVFDEHVFEHPVFTGEAIEAQKRLPRIQGQRGSWFCGAYTRYGFHEDGLQSAVHVATALGAEVPWR